jgi:hypothetical protein
MTASPNKIRRKVLVILAASPLLLSTIRLSHQNIRGTRSIPSTGELLPLVCLGSWISFNVGDTHTRV